jgi:uncharacterized protein (TIGR04141 family)
MTADKDKKFNLSVYLIKESYIENASIVPNCGEMRSFDIKDDDGFLGTLYIKTNYTNIPKWAELFRGVFSPEDIGLYSRSARAVFLVTIDSRKMCLTFGHSHFLVEPLSIVKNFGLKVALNIGGESSLRAVDKTSLDVIEIKSKEQSSKEVGIANFDFDFETDILKAITAKNEEGSAIITGRDSIRVGAAVTINSLRVFLNDILETYKSDAYKQKFSWVDNISEERDKSVLGRLNQELAQRVQTVNPDVWLAIPEVILWEEINGFAYKKGKMPVLRYDINLEKWCAEVAKDNDIDIDFLKRRKIFIYDVNNELYKQWPIYNCLNAEINLDGQKYVLNDGCWYALKDDFVSDVCDYYASIDDSSVELPPYGRMKEPEYNKFIAGTHEGEFDLMDCKTIPIGPGRSSIEFCDLFAKDKRMIHVKKYGGSSVLSHLFQQGVVSGDLFLSDFKFRDAVNCLLSEKCKLEDIEARPDPSKYEICFAIMSEIPGGLRIPFFSMVVMKNAVKRLQTYGYTVTKKKIPIS